MSEIGLTDAEEKRTKQVLHDFYQAKQEKQKVWLELNDKTMLDTERVDWLNFNQYVEPASGDPDEDWKSRAIDSSVRQKAIEMSANLTAKIIQPNILAQNQSQENDKLAGTVMTDLVEFACYEGDYDMTFMYAIVATMYSPLAIVHVEYGKGERIEKYFDDFGVIQKRVAPDPEYSGIQFTNVPLSEFYLADYYQRRLQRQPYVFWRKVVSYEEAETRFGNLENFKYVKPGVRAHFNSAGALEYIDHEDEDVDRNSVEIAIYYNRFEDLQIPFLNGIIHAHPDSPIPRIDKRYPFAVGGFEPIDGGKYALYKSLAAKLRSDSDDATDMKRMLVDAAKIQAFPPSFLFGDFDAADEIFVPGRVTPLDNLSNPNAGIQTIQSGSQMQGLQVGLEDTRRSIGNSSSDMSEALGSSTRQTALQVSQITEQQKTMLKITTRTIGGLAKDLGELIVSDILQHYTVGEVNDISGLDIKHKSFLLPEKTVDGKEISKKIMFSMDLPMKASKHRRLKESIKVFDEENEKEGIKIYKMNPTVFRSLNYNVRVVWEPKVMHSEALERAENLELYAALAVNPLIDQQVNTRDVLLRQFEVTKKDPDKFMLKQQTNALGIPEQGNNLQGIMNAQSGQKAPQQEFANQQLNNGQVPI